jgi:hypothetical protein
MFIQKRGQDITESYNSNAKHYKGKIRTKSNSG